MPAPGLLPSRHKWRRIAVGVLVLCGRLADAAEPSAESGTPPPEPSALAAVIRDSQDAAQIEAAIASLHAEAVRQLRELLRPRLEAGPALPNDKLYDSLTRADERLAILQRGARLPSFLHTPPTPFSGIARPPARLRVIAMGDFGTGTPEQRAVAAAIAKVHRRQPFALGITVGDNFYDTGLPSPEDPRWQERWESLYSPLKIPFYASFGNHDWYNGDSPASELIYARANRSSSWRMPATYYTFTVGNLAQFFALDTENFTAAQAQWLEAAIAASTAQWKIVYGHHPISDTMNYSIPEMRQRVWPILRGKVDVYLCGHTHSLGQMSAEDGVSFVIAGGGGRKLHKIEGTAAKAPFAASMHGFAALEIATRQIDLTLYSNTGAAVHSTTLSRKP